MKGFPRRVVCLVACAVMMATPHALVAQSSSTAPKTAPKPATRPAPAPAKPQAVAPARPQAAPPAPKPPAGAPAPKPQAAAPAPKPQTPVASAKPPAAAPAAPSTAATSGATPSVRPAAPVAPSANTAAAKPDDDLAPAGYDPQGRRDPFVSLLQRGGSIGQRAGLGARAAGLAGLETSEVTLRGTLLSQGAYVGIVQGSDNKTYIVKSGDKLSDGEIRSITPDTMVIMQQVTDPLSLEKQREVRKLLRPTTEEAK